VNREQLQWSVFLIETEKHSGTGSIDQTPVLVVSRESANDALPVVTVIPLAGLKAGRRIYPNETCLPSDATALDSSTVLMAHQIRTIPKSWLSTRLGSLDDPGHRSAVQTAVRIQLDLEPGAIDRTETAMQLECGI
jgi:mRNA-degrading endonuclease toxin of MazEF toxin-antitoxin module